MYVCNVQRHAYNVPIVHLICNGSSSVVSISSDPRAAILPRGPQPAVGEVL